VWQRVVELCIPRLHDNHIVPALLRRTGIEHTALVTTLQHFFAVLVSIDAAESGGEN
jgi:hypothetical protein